MLLQLRVIGRKLGERAVVEARRHGAGQRGLALVVSQRLAEEDRPHRDEDVHPATHRRDQATDRRERHHQVHCRRVFDPEGGACEGDVVVPAWGAEGARERHRQREDEHAEGEDVRLESRQRVERDLLPEDQRNHVVGDPHERHRRAGYHRRVEVTRNPQRVVRHDVDLLGPEGHAGDAAHEAEDDDREDHRAEARVVPRGPAQPPEDALSEPAEPHPHLHAGRDREAVQHRRQHRHVHEVRGVDDLPRRPESRVDQEVVRGSHRDEEDVEHERRATDLLVHHDRAHGERTEQIPDRDHRRDVDLLRRVTQAPPHQAVDLRVDVHEVERPQERRDVDRGAVGERDRRDDRRGDRPEGHERYRSRVRLLALRHDQGGEEDPGHQDRSHREQDHTEIEERVSPEWHVRREEHVGAAGEHRPLDHERADDHQHEGQPPHLGCCYPTVEQDGGREVEHRHLEEDDEEDEHVHAVDREPTVEQLFAQQVNDLPAGQQDQNGRDAAHQERDGGHHRVRLDQRVRVTVDLQAGRGACPEESGALGRGAHCSPPAPAAGSTRTLPTMRWCPTPQNSLQTMR